jgi:two-component system chemotaxis sensor kinase CheA
MYRLRDRLLPLAYLDEVLANDQPFDDPKRQELNASRRKRDKLAFIVLRIGSERYGLVVAEVIGSEDIVVKPMHPALSYIPSFSGSTILGDGSIALILDAAGISRHVGIDLAAIRASDDDRETHEHSDVITQLLFTVSGNEQLALPLPLIKRIVTINRDQLETIGDHTFVQVDGASLRVLNLGQHLNLNTPEQDSYSLILPRHIKRPLGILVGAIRDIHDQSIHVEPSTLGLNGVIGTAVINDTTTLFIDLFALAQHEEPSWFTNDAIPDCDEQRTGNILLIEDTSFFQRLVSGYLTSVGHRVTIAGDGRQGLDELDNTGPFDAIVCDLEMPVMNGFDFVHTLRAGPHRHLPALALSALADDQSRSSALAAGFDAYEIKMEKERLLNLVNGMLSGVIGERA